MPPLSQDWERVDNSEVHLINYSPHLPLTPALSPRGEGEMVPAKAGNYV